MKIGIIGGGRVGCCLAGYFKQAGILAGITAASDIHSKQLSEQFSLPYQTNAVLWQNADVILLTVPDRFIAAVALELTEQNQCFEKTVLHMSGSLGLDVLNPLAKQGAHVGSLHPLQSFAGGETNLTGVYMAVDGDAVAKKTAQKLAEILKGKTFSVPSSERAAYHAAACICSNYAVTIQVLAQQLMSRWTGSDVSAWQALLPLFKGTADNMLKLQLPAKALTGPIARGDVATVSRHLSVLPLEIYPLYCSLGLATVKLALTNGTIDSTAAEQLKAMFSETCNGGMNNGNKKTSHCSNH